MAQDRDISVRDAASEFRAVKRGGYASNTWASIDRVLTRFEDWIYMDVQPGIYLRDVDDRHLVRFFDRLRPPAYQPNTFNNYRQYMSLFFLFCREEGWIHTNPLRHVRPMKVARKVRLQLSSEELLRMLELTDLPRDRAALAVGMNTALRAGDAMALKVGSLDFYTNHLTAFQQKTKREIELPMTAELRIEMLRWLEIYANDNGLTLQELPNDWTLLPPCRGVAVDVNDLTLGFTVQYKVHEVFRHPEVIVQKALSRMGYETKGEGFHTLRRSALRALYDAGLEDGDPDPIRLAQALADHASRGTTELYLGITHEKRLLDEKLRGRNFLSRPASVDTAGSAPTPIKREGRSA